MASFLRGVSAAMAGPASSVALAARKSRRESIADPRSCDGASTGRTETVINLTRQIELGDLDPFVFGVCLRDVPGAKDHRRYPGGGRPRCVSTVGNTDPVARAGHFANAGQQFVGEREVRP